MERRISLRRRELVWEEYVREWGEADFEELKEWLSTRIEDPHYAARYFAMKDVSFDELCDMFDGKREDIKYELHCGDENHSWTYNECLTDYIRELMREEAWDYGCYDSWGADDSDEELEIYERENSVA